MPKKILIVEDNSDMQEIYRSYFEDRGDEFDVEIGGKAEVALRKTREAPYDLVILDIIMEPMTGESFLVYLRENPQTSKVPVIVISVLGPEMLSQLGKYDKVEFLQKPVAEDRLIDTLNTML